jgi:AcrR family transcriptional regulator
MSAELSGARARRRQALVDEIVEAADELVNEEGLAGLSMRDLGKRVGLHSSSLYQYFPSKLDIYDALFARWHRQLHDWMSSFDRDGDPEQVFRTGSARFTAFCIADPVRYQLLFQRTIPDFVPSEASMALARASYADMAGVLARLGIVDAADLDLWPRCRWASPTSSSPTNRAATAGPPNSTMRSTCSSPTSGTPLGTIIVPHLGRTEVARDATQRLSVTVSGNARTRRTPRDSRPRSRGCLTGPDRGSRAICTRPAIPGCTGTVVPSRVAVAAEWTETIVPDHFTFEPGDRALEHYWLDR